MKNLAIRAAETVLPISKLLLAYNPKKVHQTTNFCFLSKLSGSNPSATKNCRYRSPSWPPGNATSLPGKGMITSKIEYLSTSSAVNVLTFGGSHALRDFFDDRPEFFEQKCQPYFRTKDLRSPELGVCGLTAFFVAVFLFAFSLVINILLGRIRIVRFLDAQIPDCWFLGTVHADSF